MMGVEDFRSLTPFSQLFKYIIYKNTLSPEAIARQIIGNIDNV